MNTQKKSFFELVNRDGSAVFKADNRWLRVWFVTSSIVRVSYTEGRPFQQNSSQIVVADLPHVEFTIQENAEGFLLITKVLTVAVNRNSGALRYRDTDGEVFLQEPDRGGKWLTQKEVWRNVFGRDNEVAYAQSVDGARATATQYETVLDRLAFEAKLEFVFDKHEALFGFGSHEEGYCNLRGKSRELYQQNMKAVVPYFVSTRGYGVLFDCMSLMNFHDDAYGSYWWADVVEELDFYVIRGGCFQEVTRGYHLLTGSVPMLPKWAFGYVQSKERYVNASELVEVVQEYRRHRVPLDTIVLDWKSWPNGGGWGQKSLDPVRFPDPKGFVEELHDLGAHLMVSIWPIMTGGCPNQRELLENDLMLGNQATYDAFSSEARAAYWEQAREGLFDHGVDAWWCDCTEPFEADWTGAVKPEPHARLAINTQESKLYLDPGKINGFSLLHSRGIYEGQRSVSDTKRVVNLTRSSYAGQHRYGTITWNGDICATWEVLRRSIAEGLNFCATGEPYWTVDIGGFFISDDPALWFWRGDYPDGCRGLTDMHAVVPDPRDNGSNDLGYWELYTRWLQYGTFLPMMRSHGTDAAREIWRFGEEGTPFYEAIAESIRLRYRLIPYIYSLAGQVSLRSGSIMQAVALEFPGDRATYDLKDQYLFGPALLVCPVTEPMFYGAGSRKLAGGSQSREVYLPANTSWYDFRTYKLYAGGQTISALASLQAIPVYARAGSVVPLTRVMQFVDEYRDAPYEVLVFTGEDALFTLYEDSGDGYGYENEKYSLVAMRWTQQTETFTIATRLGDFPSLISEREFRISFISGAGVEIESVLYRGEEVTIRAART